MQSSAIQSCACFIKPAVFMPLLWVLFFSIAKEADGAPEMTDPNTWKWNDPQDLKISGMHHCIIESASMKRTVGFNIYLPPQYEKEPARRFPVVYFLHGSTGTESSDAGLARYVHAEIVAGSIDPVIYIFPNGGAESGYRDWPDSYVKSETLIVRELLPYIDREYRTIAQPGARGICGFSMGGGGAMRLALKYPNLFGAAASLAAALEQTAEDFGGDNCYRHASALSQNDRNHLYLYLVIGEDDYLLSRHKPFLKHLKELGIKYTYVIHSKVTHNLGVYTELSGRAMIEHLSRELARNSSRP
jgi:enterochelin esterase-like enzyme